MKMSARPEFDVVALNTTDSVLVLLEIEAPERVPGQERPAATLQVVVDRSGSMTKDRRIEGVVEALHGLVDRLDPTDHFGLVSFNTQAKVEVPAGPLTDKESLRHRLSQVRAHGGTDLSSGLFRGIQEARRASEDRGATLLLISDGHANQGTTDHDLLREVAHDAYEHGVTVTTLGYGLGYDEELLGAVSEGGAGSALFAEDPDTAGGLIADETEYLLAKTAQAASLTIRGGEFAERVSVVGESSASRLDDGALMVELGDFFSGESRRLLLRLSTAVLAEAGKRDDGENVVLAKVELTHVDPATLASYIDTLEVKVRTAWRVDRREADERVRAEELFQEAQTAKRRASDAMRRGSREEAARHLRDSVGRIREAQVARPFTGIGDEMASQARALEVMARQAEGDDAQRAAKTFYASSTGGTRGRGPQGRDGGRLGTGPSDKAEGEADEGARGRRRLFGGRDRSGESFPDAPSGEEG